MIFEYYYLLNDIRQLLNMFLYLITLVITLILCGRETLVEGCRYVRKSTYESFNLFKFSLFHD